MTVQTEFFDWGRNPMTPDPRTCAPIGRTWMSYLLGRWGGQDLGCYAPRPVVGGSTPSTHASGAAIDWRYQDPGIGRQRMLDEIMPGLLSLSRDLGVQAVHDYVGCRIWRPPGTSGRPTSPSPECGWRQQTPGSQMGQPWALWLHIECLNTRWSDTRTVEQMLAGSSGGGSDIPPPEEDDEMTFEGFWRTQNNGTTSPTFAVFRGGYKVLIQSQYQEAARNRYAMQGATGALLQVQTTDPQMFRAFGPIVGFGAVDNRWDGWGVPV